MKEETSNSRIPRFNNGSELIWVSLDIDNKRREYITNIVNLSEIYIYYIYMRK